MTAVAAALAAALLFALATVLQQRAASAVPDAQAGAGLLLRLVRRPLWLAGIAVDGVGFLCHAAALSAGRLVVVQPLLSTSLVFALPLGAALAGRRVTPREMLAALAVAGGLAGFLAAADPAGGRNDAAPGAWLAALMAAALACAAARALGRGTPARRAVGMGIAAGILFGLNAALIKATVERLDEGLLHVLADWHVWGVVTVGYAATSFAQASLQTGALGPGMAAQAVVEPLTSVLVGVALLAERLHASPPLALAAIALMAAGTASLALSAPAAERRPVVNADGGPLAPGLVPQRLDEQHA